MKVKNTALRLAGAAMIAVALAPWVGGAAANAAVTVYLDAKWNGTNSATSTVVQADCAYDEVHLTHAGQGWHFVLPGGSGLTSFTASFQTAGLVTVTTTETASGVIVQDGKGAVVYTPTADVLVAAFNGHAGQGTAESAPNEMQLSHLCTGSTPTPTPTPTPSTSSAPATTPATVTTTPAASVLPTKASASPEVSVKGTKTVLPHTGSGVKVGLLLATSLALLLGGGAMMMLPGLAPARGKRRRH